MEKEKKEEVVELEVIKVAEDEEVNKVEEEQKQDVKEQVVEMDEEPDV